MTGDNTTYTPGVGFVWSSGFALIKNMPYNGEWKKRFGKKERFAGTLMGVKLSIIVPFYNMEKTLAPTMDALLNISLPVNAEDMKKDAPSGKGCDAKTSKPSPAESQYEMVSTDGPDFEIVTADDSSNKLAATDCPGFEIIAVDDSSTDGTLRVLKDYEVRHPDRVRVFKTPKNLRQGGARNIGLKMARGEWIGFMDGDDYPSPLMYKKLIVRAEATGADVAACYYTKVFDHSFIPGQSSFGNPIDQAGPLDDERARSLILEPCSMVTKIYKASVIRENNLKFPEGIFYEDNAASPIWMLHFKHFEVVEEPLYFYYQNPTSTTHTITKKRCYDRMKAGQLLVDMAKEKGFYQSFPQEFEAAFTRLYYTNTLFSYLIGSNENDIGFLRELRDGVIKEFPDFRKNPYYDGSFDEEQKKLINLHIKSPALFLAYYRLLSFYRRLRYR